MLSLKNFSVSYDGVRVIDGIDLDIKKGRSLAIIGESGAGKTTLGLAIMGLVGTKNGRVEGSVVFKDKELLALSKSEMNKIRWNEMALVPQNIENALNPMYRAVDQVVEPMMKDGAKNKSEAYRHALKLLEMTGLKHYLFHAYPHQLSGGEKQRVLIAVAMANNPDFLILDEPTSSLDPLIKNEILELLVSLREKYTLLIITHDISVAGRLADTVAVMYAGKIVEMGAANEILTRPRHPYTRGLLRAYPNMTTTKDLQGVPGKSTRPARGCVFYPRCTQAIKKCAETMPPLEESKGRMLACHRGGILSLLQVKGLCKSFNGRKVVNAVNLTVEEGETLALVGESGSGKTTLAKAVMGLIAPSKGEIYVEKKKVEKRDKSFYCTVQMIFQNPGDAVSHRLSVLEAVREPLDIHQLGSKEEREEKAIRAISEVELPILKEFLNRYAHHLSGGELQRVVIARALVLSPKLLIADEPTSSLDASVQAKIIKLLLELQEKRGLAMLFITHDIALARKISDRMAVMVAGKIVEEGPTSKIVNAPVHPFTKKMLDAAPYLGVCMDNKARGNELRAGQTTVRHAW